MGLQYRRRVRIGHGRNTWVNVSKSGVSVSHRRGRTTVNTRGSFWVRVTKGLFYRGRV
jgi:hypothetical protein